MSRQLNRALFQALQKQTKPALESEEVVVAPAATEGNPLATAAAVTAGAGEGGEAPAAAAPAAEVTITVKVETPTTPAAGVPGAAAAAETDALPPGGLDGDLSAPANDLSVDGATAVDAVPGADAVAAPGADLGTAAPADAAPAADAGLGDLGAADALATDSAPAEGGGDTVAEAPAADAAPAADGEVAAAAAPAEGEQTAEAPAEGETATAVAETPAEGEAAAPAVADAVAEVPAEAAPAATAEPEAAAAPAADAAPEAPAADAAAPAEGEAAVEVPAGEAPPAVDAAAAPADGVAAPAEGDVTPETGAAATAVEPAPGEAAAADDTPAAAEVDAKPSTTDEETAAAEVQAAIDASKADGEEKTEAAVGEEGIAAVEPAAAAGGTPEASVDAVQAAIPVIDEVEAIHESEIAPDIEEVAAELNAYQDGAETMAKIASILEMAAEEGGMNEAGAKVMEVAVEHIHNTLKLKKPVGILAMETFALPGGDRIDATNFAMEAVNGTVQNVWKTILESIQKFMGMVVEFYNKVSSGALIQQKQAAAVIAQAKQMGDKKVAGVISSPTLAHKLAIQSNVSQNLASDLVNSGKVCMAALQQGFGLAQAGRELLQSPDISAGKAKLLEAVVKASSAIMSANANPADVGMEAAPDGTVAYTSPIMLGNYCLTACVPKGVEELSKATFGVAHFEAEMSKTDLPILNTEQVVALAQVVTSHAGALADMKKAEAEVKAAAQAFQAYANKAVTDGSKPDATIVRLVKEFSAGLLRNSARILYANNSAVLEYCSVSLKKLGGATEGAPAAAAPAAPAAAAA